MINLYLKDIKRLSAPFLLILMLYGWFVLWLYFTDLASAHYSGGIAFYYYDLSKFFLFWSLLLVPGMLIYSIYEEYAAKTLFQMFSLPAPRYKIILHKYLAVLNIGIFVVLFITLYNYLFELKLQQLPNNEYQFMNPFSFALFLFSLIVYLLGIVCTGAGLLFSIKRFHIAAVLLLIVPLFPLYGIFSLFYNNYEVSRSIYLIIEGFSLLIIGLYIFEKYSDL